MFYIKVTLVSLIIVVYGQIDDGKIDKISSNIEKMSTSLQLTKSLIKTSSPDIKTAIEGLQDFADIRELFFPQLKVFASSIGWLSGLIDRRELIDDKIIKSLTKIKESTNYIEKTVNGLVPKIKKEIIKQMFIENIQNKINDMQNMYNELAQRPNRPNKEALIGQCRDNDMKHVLTDIHNQIVNEGDGYMQRLLDGGSRHEMKSVDKWSKALHAVYMQATLLRSVCAPLMQTQEGWQDQLVSQVEGHKKDFKEITEVIKKKLIQLKDNYTANAKRALPEYLAMSENWSDWGWQIMINAVWYLNDNFNPGDGLKWNVIVMPEGQVKQVKGDLVRVNRKGWAVFAGYGRLTKAQGCGQWNLFCQKIGANKITFEGGKIFDSHEQDGYYE